MDPETEFVLFKKMLPKDLLKTIETNKHDYGDFPKALRYVQEQLRKHQEKSHPTPMDVGAVDQEQQQQQQPQGNETNTQQAQNANEQNQCQPTTDNQVYWGIDALGKGGKAKGKGGFQDTRDCYHCGRKGHIKADCHFKHLPQSQTPLGLHMARVASGTYVPGKGKGKGGKGFSSKGWGSNG